MANKPIKNAWIDTLGNMIDVGESTHAEVGRKILGIEAPNYFYDIMNKMYDKGYIRFGHNDNGVFFTHDKITPQIVDLAEDNLAKGKNVFVQINDGYFRLDPNIYKKEGLREAFKDAINSDIKGGISSNVMKTAGFWAPILGIGLNLIGDQNFLNPAGAKSVAAGTPREWAMAQGPAPLRPSFIKDDIQGTLNGQ